MKFIFWLSRLGVLSLLTLAIVAGCVTRGLQAVDTLGVAARAQSTCAPIVLIERDSVWRYLDDGTDQGSDWRALTFNDTGWPSGPAELGYGDVQTTTVSYGPDGGNKPITTYFRHAFTLTNADDVSALQLDLQRDDGAVIYLNGTEVARSNMPTSAIIHTTLAITTVSSNNEQTFFNFPLTKSVGEGKNVVAVEIHQVSPDSSDIGFNLRLSGQRGCPTPTPTPSPPPCVPDQAATTRFAVIGDFGANTSAERDVAGLVKGWNPQFVVTTGDNSYPDASTLALLDTNVGKYYWEYIYPYTGTYTVSIGAPATPIAPASFNRFWPVAGNHDWNNSNGLSAYRDFFNLPGNERYYSVTVGSVGLFMIGSDPNEPDGIDSQSIQAQWLQSTLATSSAPWKIVVFHHPVFTSGILHPSNPILAWPFKAWGADIVLNGHVHNYERFEVDGFPYIVNGLGGNLIYLSGLPIAGSLIQYDDFHGAQLVDANQHGITFSFYNLAKEKIDQLTLGCPPAPFGQATPTPTATATPVPTAVATLPTSTPTKLAGVYLPVVNR